MTFFSENVIKSTTMLNINEKRLYKGELVRIRGTGFCCKDPQPPGNMHWEKCRYCSWSIGSLLLDFNNFTLDKTVFLLHPADYMEKPTLVTLMRMAKFCEWESELVLSNIARRSYTASVHAQRSPGVKENCKMVIWKIENANLQPSSFRRHGGCSPKN